MEAVIYPRRFGIHKIQKGIMLVYINVIFIWLVSLFQNALKIEEGHVL